MSTDLCSESQADQAIEAMKSGKRWCESIPEGGSETWWDADAQTFRNHTSVSNPYTGEPRESNDTLSEANVRRQLLARKPTDWGLKKLLE